MIPISARDLYFLLPFGLAVLFMLWVLWNFTLQRIRKREASDATRANVVGALRDAPAPLPTPLPRRRPEPVPLQHTTHSVIPGPDDSSFEFRRMRL